MDNIVIIMFACVIFVGILMLVIIGTARKRPKNIDKTYYAQRITQIEDLLISGGDNDANIAILNADKLLDGAMQTLGFKGQTLGERLKFSPKGKFSNYRAIWAAHKLRNRIAHENDVKISSVQAKKVIGTYKKALRDLGAL